MKKMDVRLDLIKVIAEVVMAVIATGRLLELLSVIMDIMDMV